MCIIMVKPKNVPLPDKKTFKICYENNSDGCGYMYVDNGEVVIRKGFMGYKNMYKEIKALGNEKAICVHFRIGTHGTLKSQANTHPYPISSHVSDLKALSLRTDVAVMHNGIISGYTDTAFPDLNDTQIFIKDVLTVLKNLNKEFYTKKSVLTMLDDMTTSKLVFLDKHEELFYVGNFIDENGVKYSNSNYKENVWKNYNYYHDRYYDEYYDSEYNYPITTSTIEDINSVEINTKNCITIVKNWWMEYGTTLVQVDENNKYAMDNMGVIFELHDDEGNFPGKIISIDGTVYDENYEEVII